MVCGVCGAGFVVVVMLIKNDTGNARGVKVKQEATKG